MENVIESFEKNGFYLFKSVFTPDEINEFRKACEKLINEPRDEFLGDTTHIKSDAFKRSRKISELFFDDKLIKRIKDVLGDHFHIIPEISVMKSQFGRWHKDTTSIELFGQDFHKNENFRVVNVAIYCQDNNEYGGGLDVVPGSHKENDPYTDYYRKESDEHEKKKQQPKVEVQTPKPGLITLMKRGVGRILRSTPFIKKYFITKQIFTHPLDSEDTKQNKYKIPTEAGDVAIFDLRLDHKASWPTVQIEDPDKHVKYAFFAICGRNNEETVHYREYLNERSKTQEAYAYLKDYQLNDYLGEMEKKFNITLS